MASLVQDVIELSRLQPADVVGQAKLVDMNQLVASSVELNRVTAEGREISLETSGVARRSVHGDAELLGTALRNLIENAIRYSPEGTRVEVSIQDREDEIEVSVKDQGPGIPLAEQDRILSVSTGVILLHFCLDVKDISYRLSITGWTPSLSLNLTVQI